MRGEEGERLKKGYGKDEGIIKGKVGTGNGSCNMGGLPYILSRGAYITFS